jgi:very-short-patch-repair endonuclease
VTPLVEPFRGSAAVAGGVLTPAQLRGPRWQRVLPDVYVAAGVELTHELRARAAVVLLPGAVVTGLSAAWLWQVDVDGPDGAAHSSRVEVTVPPGGNARVPGLLVRRRALPDHQVGCPPWLRDVPTLWPDHAALELAADPARDHVESVVVLDQFCAAGRASLTSLRRAATGWSGRGCRLLQAALRDADGLAGSPPETRLRLGMRAAGLPAPVAQHRLVRATGQRVKYLDFAWPHLRLAVEYDGSNHVLTSTRPEAGFALPKDRRVLNEVQELGWQLFYVTAPDHRDLAGVVARIGSALAARAAQLGVPLHPAS